MGRLPVSMMQVASCSNLHWPSLVVNSWLFTQLPPAAGNLTPQHDIKLTWAVYQSRSKWLAVSTFSVHHLRSFHGFSHTLPAVLTLRRELYALWFYVEEGVSLGMGPGVWTKGGPWHLVLNSCRRCPSQAVIAVISLPTGVHPVWLCSPGVLLSLVSLPYPWVTRCG